MTRVEFGRLKRGDILYNHQNGLFRVIDLESQANRTKKCVIQSVGNEEKKLLAVDETECSLWLLHN